MQHYNLERFLKIHDNIYETALNEIKNGRKQSHWMWYFFPQIAGLGYSPMAVHYSISDLKEAVEYYEHPVLRKRLVTMCQELLKLEESDPLKILGYPDNLKLRSCMTLFSVAVPQDVIFEKILNKFYDGKPDQLTLDIIK